MVFTARAKVEIELALHLYMCVNLKITKLKFRVDEIPLNPGENAMHQGWISLLFSKKFEVPTMNRKYPRDAREQLCGT